MLPEELLNEEKKDELVLEKKEHNQWERKNRQNASTMIHNDMKVRGPIEEDKLELELNKAKAEEDSSRLDLLQMEGREEQHRQLHLEEKKERITSPSSALGRFLRKVNKREDQHT